MPQPRTRTQQNLVALTFASVLATTVCAWGLSWNKNAARDGRDARGTSSEQSLQLEDEDRKPR